MSKLSSPYAAPTHWLSRSPAKSAPTSFTPSPDLFKAMEKAILASDVGITPANDGTKLRLVFPQPTEERRRELAKQIQKFGEDAKVAIRNIRRDANDLCKKMKKDGEMTEDEQKASEKSIQDLTDKYVKDVDAVTAKKEKEIMQI